MNDRDRLAVDLHPSVCGPHDHAFVPDGKRACQLAADRLIALGWTRLDEEDGPAVTVDWTNDVIAGLERQLRDCREYSLDEERLARALALMSGAHPKATSVQRRDVGDYRLGLNVPWVMPTISEFAAAIAKAYREDTDVTD